MSTLWRNGNQYRSGYLWRRRSAAGLRTDAEWICTNCKTEFNSEFCLESDRIKTIYNAKVTLLDKKDCQPNFLGESSTNRGMW